MTFLKIGINGAYGKMGKEIEQLISNNPEKYQLVTKIGRTDDIEILKKACNNCDIIMDFSSKNGVTTLISAAVNGTAKLLIGTTGLDEKQLKALEDIAQNLAILYAPNTSLGANLIMALSAKAAQILDEYDVEIIEAHHRLKKDAPSGTALMIGQEIAKAKNINFKEKAIFSRCQNGIRQKDEIGFCSIRGGGIYGDNEVMFAGENEVVTIGCKALSRKAFAYGALVAASWLHDKGEGLYSMKDVLCL